MPQTAQTLAPARNSAPNMIARLLLTIMGTAMGVSAFGVWLVPGGSGLPDLTMMKLAASVMLLILGLSCIFLAREARDSAA